MFSKFLSSSNASDLHTIYLFPKLNINDLEFIPRIFQLTTNNSIGKFNKEILANSSTVISDFIKENPNNLQYHLDFDDQYNILEKIEQLFLGKSVKINEDENNSISEFFSLLQIRNRFSDYLSNNIYFVNKQFNIYPKIPIKFFQEDYHKSFTIQTNQNKYKCNMFGVIFSDVIRKIISNDPTIDHYKYDFDDENGEFQIICDIFNLNSIKLTKNNYEIIKEIAEDLEIQSIVRIINEFDEKYYKVEKLIDDQQERIDKIDELFNHLYQIKEESVDSVFEFIKKSRWSKNEENILDLASFIIQVIQTDFQLHKYLLDLLIKLDEIEKMNILFPFIIKRLFSLIPLNIDENSLILPFIYEMYKREIISKEQIGKLISEENKNKYVSSWFLPIFYENGSDNCNINFNSNSFTFQTNNLTKTNSNKILRYFISNGAKNLEEHKEMLDKGETNDEIAKIIRIDDIDSFQSIVSKDIDKLMKNNIQSNLFEPFINNKINYLNYAAAYGSVKCFKYMILNNEQIDQFTFEMAVIGGNNEIIRIVDNSDLGSNPLLNNEKKLAPSILNALYQSIKRHKNDLFDWILEQKFDLINTDENFEKLFICSIKNGNAHSLIQLIDNGYQFSDNENQFTYNGYQLINNKYQFKEKINKLSAFLMLSVENGYYSLSIVLLSLINKSSHIPVKIVPQSIIRFDNIYIFNLFVNQLDSYSIQNILDLAIDNDSVNIFKYFFNKYDGKNIKIDSNTVLILLTNCINLNHKDYLDYLIEDFNILKLLNINKLFDLLDHALNARMTELSKKITELIYKRDKTIDFTESFQKIIALSQEDLIQFYIDSNYKINYDLLDNIVSELTKLNAKTIILIMENSNSLFKDKMINSINCFIEAKNRPFVEYLLSQNVNLDNSLIAAVKSNDIEIFNLIFDFYGENIKNQKKQLEKSIQIILDFDTKSTCETFLPIIEIIINLKCIDANIYANKNTLLTFACSMNSIDMVKSLVQYEKIDVNLSIPKTGDTPFHILIENGYYDIAKILINHPQININKNNYNGYSPLFLAIKNAKSENDPFCDLIINNQKFNPEENNINLAFYISNLKPQNSNISKKLLSYKSLDVNYIPFDSDVIQYFEFEDHKIVKTSLIMIVENNDQELLDLMIHHPSFIKDKSEIMICLKIAIEKRYKLFKDLFKIVDEFGININSPIFDGKNVLTKSILANSDDEFVSDIINDPNFDSKESDIINAFILSYSKNNRQYKTSFTFIPIKLMNKLYEFDCAHDHLINDKIAEKNSTFLSSMYSTIILEGNINPNNPINNVYPLQYAIENNSYILYLCLINSNKINFKQKIRLLNQDEYTTYTHLAAGLKSGKILKDILDRNLGDINATNYLGDTPLIEACKKLRKENIELLFKMENLDFLHKNNKGLDALNLMQSIIFINKEKDLQENLIVNKDQYLVELLRLIEKLSIDEVLTCMLNNPNPELNDNAFQFIFDKMMENDELLQIYLSFLIIKDLDKRNDIESFIKIFANEIKKYRKQFMNVINKIYYLNIDDKVLLRNNNFSLYSLKIPEFGISIISKLFKSIENNPKENYQAFFCLKNIASTFPLLFYNKHQKVFDIILEAFEGFQFIFKENDENLKLIKTAYSAFSFFLSTFQIPVMFDNFIVWFNENINSFSIWQIVGLINVILYFFNNNNIIFVFGFIVWAMKINLIETISNLLNREVKEDLLFNNWYKETIYKLILLIYNLLFRLSPNINAIIQFEEYTELENPYDYLFSHIYLNNPLIYLNYEIKSVSNSFSNYMKDIDKCRDFWLFYPKHENNGVIINEAQINDFINNYGCNKYNNQKNHTIPIISFPYSIKMIQYLFMKPKFIFFWFFGKQEIHLIPPYYEMIYQAGNDLKLMKQDKDFVSSDSYDKSNFLMNFYGQNNLLKNLVNQISLDSINESNVKLLGSVTGSICNNKTALLSVLKLMSQELGNIYSNDIHLELPKSSIFVHRLIEIIKSLTNKDGFNENFFDLCGNKLIDVVSSHEWKKNSSFITELSNLLSNLHIDLPAKATQLMSYLKC